MRRVELGREDLGKNKLNRCNRPSMPCAIYQRANQAILEHKTYVLSLPDRVLHVKRLKSAQRLTDDVAVHSYEKDEFAIMSLVR